MQNYICIHTQKLTKLISKSIEGVDRGWDQPFNPIDPFHESHSICYPRATYSF